MRAAGQRGRGAARQLKALMFVLIAITLACRGQRQNVAPAAVEPAGEFSLVVNSRHMLDVNIFIQHDGQADRVATVPASSSRTLTLPSWMLGQSRLVRIIAEPIGDETRYTTDLLSVHPGEIVELNVESAIARSNYSIQ